MHYILIVFLLIFLFIKGKKDHGKFSVKDIVVISILVSISSMGRIVSSSIPSVQPSSFIIISAGMILGKGPGVLVGVLTGILSNLYLGIGPWLPWQTILWGVMGFTSSYLKGKKVIIATLFGFLWGIVFGMVMNLYWFLDGYMTFSFGAYFLSCINSFSMDLAHGLTNGILIFLFYSRNLYTRLEKMWRKK